MYLTMCVVVMFAYRHDANDPLLMQAVVKLESPVKPKLPIKVSQVKNTHLPAGALDKWRTTFVPTFVAYIGTKHDPWELKDQETRGAMQDCWDHVYKSTNPNLAKYRIGGVRDVVFVLVGTLALVKYRLMGLIG